MSAIDELIAAAVYGVRENHVYFMDAATEILDLIAKVKEEHAHELAEGIRDFAAKRTRIDSEDETYGMNMGADLIDPKVNK
jgi:hypothetical protein